MYGREILILGVTGVIMCFVAWGILWTMADAKEIKCVEIAKSEVGRINPSCDLYVDDLCKCTDYVETKRARYKIPGSEIEFHLKD